jgi:hypothetical protein
MFGLQIVHPVVSLHGDHRYDEPQSGGDQRGPVQGMRHLCGVVSFGLDRANLFEDEEVFSEIDGVLAYDN